MKQIGAPDKICFMFCLENNAFPHAKTWHAFFASAPTTAHFSVLALVPRSDYSLKSGDLSTLLALGARVLTLPRSVAPPWREKWGVGPAAIRALLQEALLETPAARRYCLLPAGSAPIYPWPMMQR
eukprot:1745877-Prymnesium_polylepis.1